MKIKEELHLIHEGITEEKFIKKLKSTFESNYNIILENAEGIDRIIKKYKHLRKTNKYSKIYIMLDLDKTRTIREIMDVFNMNSVDVDDVDIYFINPTFELIFVMCKKDKMPIGNYPKYIKDIYGVEEYNKEKKQIEKIVKQITRKDIVFLMKSLKKMSDDDTLTRSSNYYKLFDELFVIK